MDCLDWNYFALQLSRCFAVLINILIRYSILGRVSVVDGKRTLEIYSNTSFGRVVR